MHDWVNRMLACAVFIRARREPTCTKLRNLLLVLCIVAELQLEWLAEATVDSEAVRHRLARVGPAQPLNNVRHGSRDQETGEPVHLTIIIVAASLEGKRIPGWIPRTFSLRGDRRAKHLLRQIAASMLWLVAAPFSLHGPPLVASRAAVVISPVVLRGPVARASICTMCSAPSMTASINPAWGDFGLLVPGDVNATLHELTVAVEQTNLGERSPPTIDEFVATLAACAQLAEWQGALTVLKLMAAVSFEPESAHLTHAIRACGRAGQWKRAEALLLGARANGRVVNRFAYSHVIDACERAGEVELAMKTYALGVQVHALHVRPTTCLPCV